MVQEEDDPAGPIAAEEAAGDRRKADAKIVPGAGVEARARDEAGEKTARTA